MEDIGRLLKIGLQLLLLLILVLGVTACDFLKIAPGTEPLPKVTSLPLPELPDWIEQISPTGETETLAQIRIRFKEPLIPIESLESDKQQKILQKFDLVPPLPGKFRFLTPRMVGFQADLALPKATRVKVTLKAGLEDLENHRLAEDLAWTFQTEQIKLTNLPGKTSPEATVEPIALEPTLEFTSNTKLDLNSLQENLSLTPQGKQQPVSVRVALKEKETPPDYQQPQSQFDPSQRNWIYTIEPRRNLAKATTYKLEIAPGLMAEEGNLPTEAATVREVNTYEPLTLRKIDAPRQYGRFVKGDPRLEFNNGLVAASAIENITVSPQPKETKNLIQAGDNSPYVSINPWLLEPDTTYTITIKPQLQDKFGQTLGKTITEKYKTGDLAATIWVPTGLNIFPSSKNLELNISTINLPEEGYQATYQVIQPTDLVYIDSPYPRGNDNDLLPKPAQWSSFEASANKNQTNKIKVPLKEQLGAATGMLAYGVQAKTTPYQENGQEKLQEDRFYGWVQLTNLGVFAQWFPDSGLIRVHHLSDGAAVEGATVEIYQSKLNAKSRTQPQPCATATTDKTGTVKLNSQDLQQCMSAGKQSFTQPPELLVIAKENQDWAFARNYQYSGVYEYGLNAGWSDGKPQSRGTIFSDRQLYQPGEKAWLTGFSYYLQNDTLKQDKNAPYKVTLRGPDGKKSDLGTKTTNEFGTFSVELPFSANQPLGYYYLEAKGETGAEINGQFRVAEFKPPNFKVELDLNQELTTADQTVEAKVASNYLFGAPVEAGQVKYYVTRSQTNFAPKGWEQYSFGRQWFWPEEAPSVPSDVLQVSSILNEQGQSSQTIKVGEDLPYPMTYRVDAQISDVSNLSVSDSQTFTALPSNKLIGLKSNFVAEAGKPLEVTMTVNDATGKVLKGEPVRIELQKMDFSSVTQLIEGGYQPRNQVEYKSLAEVVMRSGGPPDTISLTPPESGSYRLRANFVKGKEATATDLQIWVTGEETVYWGDRFDNNRLEIKLDKDSYQPGETAKAIIQSPYPEAELYFAVVRHHPLYQKISKVKGSAPEIEFEVTPDMLPNAAVEAVLVRQGKPLEQVEEPDKLVRIGFSPFKTNLDDKYLKVEIKPEQDSLEPGAEETIQLELKNSQNQPTPGQFTVMVVNEAVLQRTGYRPPDLVETVYAEQEISTRLSDNRPDVAVNQMAAFAEAKGWGYGGGLSSGGASTRIRKDFQALAYYNGSVLADEQGQAKVSFKLPDDLTTWRVMVVATDGDMHFGNGEATFITTKPLLSNPLLPQFVRPGDRFEAGVAITNNTEQRGNLNINASLDGNLQFAEKSNTSKTLRTKVESGTQAYRLPLLATAAGEGKVQFVSKLNNRADDAFEVSLPIKPLAVTEQVVESGTTDKQVKIPFNIDKKAVSEQGGLDISLASTLIPEITAPARQVLEENALPFLEPAASQLAIAANLQILSDKYGQALTDFNPSQQASQSLAQLQKLQHPDGGFGFWPGQESSDPFVTPYVAESLAQADAAGLNVDAGMVSRVKTYLQKTLANPGQYDFCKQRLCKNQLRLKALLALAELGDKRNDFLADIYSQRDELDQVDQIKLTRYLFNFPQWQQEGQTLFNQLQETVYETGRTAKVNLPQGWHWLSSHTSAQAETLRLFIAQDAKQEVLDRLLQGLLTLRREGTWPTSYDNAVALTALVEYSQLQPTPPNFQAKVQLAGKRLASERFQGYRNPSTELKVSITELPNGQNDLVLEKSGQGTLHYLTAYRYRLTGNQPGRLNGLRVTREVRPANQEEVLRKMGLYTDDEPLTVSAGQVFDIGLEIITDHPVEHVVITDHLPAGFEAVDTSFQTATSALQAQADSWQISYQTIYRDRITAYANRLAAGVYNLHYLVRSVTPGVFEWPGAEAYLKYAPEEFGRSASSVLEVQE